MMRAFIRFTAVFAAAWLVFGSVAGATLINGGFHAGNKLYAAGRFGEAAEFYERQVRQGEYSANLFYNLGNAYYRQGNQGRAILSYQRALILDPAHAEAAANLAFVRGAKPTAPTSRAGWIATTLPWVTATAGWLGLAGIIIAVSGNRRRVAGWSLAVVGLLACAAGSATIWFLGPADETGRAVVIADSAPAYYAPAENSKVVTTLIAGGEVRVLSDQGAWLYTLLGDGTLAWMAADKVERVVPR